MADTELYDEYYQQHPYYALLRQIQDKTIAVNTQKNLLSVNLFKIDLDTREIIAPPGYTEFIGITGEHKSETITFQVDRYYEDIDLANMTIVVEYVNADGEGRVSPIVLRDYDTFPDQILFDWIIDAGMTKSAGIVYFDVRFYMVGDSVDGQPENRPLVYSLRTRPFTSNVIDTLPLDPDEFEEQYRDAFADQLDALIGATANLETKIENKELYWIDIV